MPFGAVQSAFRGRWYRPLATIQRTQPRVRSNMLGGAPTVRFGGGIEDSKFIEAASQTYKTQDFVYIDSSGNTAIATVDGSGILNTPIAGLAAADASGVTGAKARVVIVTEMDLIEMNLWHSTAASSALARTMLGKMYGIEKQANIWSVDLETSTEPGSGTPLIKVKIVDFLSDIGDIYPRVLVRFLPFTLVTDGSGIVRNLQF